MKQKDEVEGTVGWDQMVGKTSWTSKAIPGEQAHSILVCTGLSPLPRFLPSWWSAEKRQAGVLGGSQYC